MRRTFYALLATALLASSLACEQTEHGIFLEAHTQGDVESLAVTVVDLAGRLPTFRSSPRPIRRTAEDINGNDPIRIAIPLPGPTDVLVHLEANGPGAGARYVATRCYVGAGPVIHDTLTLVGPIGTDLDADSDGFPADPATICRDPSPTGGVQPCDFACSNAAAQDCNDRDESIYPGAREICLDQIDQDCDGADAECEDSDSDGYPTCAATSPPGTCDCEDGMPDIFPGAEEICRDGIDQNCDGRDGLCDLDGDGFPAGQDVGGAPDCDDTDPAISPSAIEVCTDTSDPTAVPLDEDCNGFIDDAEGCTPDDLDRDGWPYCTGAGNGPCTRADCDCNDCDSGIYPGAAELCGNGIDEDQSGSDLPCDPSDLDRDGFIVPLDCEESNANRYPGAPETCGNGIAEGCIQDVACEGRDADGDGFVPPADCGEADATQHPGAIELCNALDDDCDGTFNEVLAPPDSQFPQGRTGCVPSDTRLGDTCDDGACALDFRASIYHCGGCRSACNVEGGLRIADRCVDGQCDCAAEPGIGSCAMGRSCCADLAGLDGGCVDLQNDVDNCGVCGNLCEETTDTCTSGACTCGAGPACDPNGATSECCGGQCVDLENDVDNCGVCGLSCGASSVCRAGVCQCNDGFANCNSMLVDGCEINITNDVSHCGACQTACQTSNGTPACQNRQCVIASCNALFADCDLRVDNGCEQSLETLQHCGTCNTPCSRPNAIPNCAGGTCRIGGCNTGFDTCDGQDPNGCETSLATLTDCGTCRSVCSLANATETCVRRTCEIASCASGFDNCDTRVDTGCETNLGNDANNCGRCGTRCGVNARCASNACQCDAPFGNCDNDFNTGCEVNTQTSALHCGRCNNSCGARASCASGACRCDANFADCDAVQATGCETNLLQSTQNCGSCGNNCGANSVCTGTCGCQANFANCDGTLANGCERNLANDVDHCGVCNRSCGTHATCSSGNCQCVGSFANCNDNLGDGCEVDRNSDPNNCGACGNRCGASATCVSGVCRCSSPFLDCDNSLASPLGLENGCEVDPRSTATCGGCGGPVCQGNQMCNAATGTCFCPPGLFDCDGSLANGCESSDSSCGGRADTCPNGVCRCGSGAVCSAGSSCCSGACVNRQTSTTHCGVCGNGCGPNSTCEGGICGCMAPFLDCDMSQNALPGPDNGCEVNSTTATRCDQCGGPTCTAPDVCRADGTCGCPSGFLDCDGFPGCEADIALVGPNCNGNADACDASGRCRCGASAACGTSNRNGCCGGFCEPLDTDLHCGTCDIRCDTPTNVDRCTETSPNTFQCTCGTGSACPGMQACSSGMCSGG